MVASHRFAVALVEPSPRPSGPRQPQSDRIRPGQQMNYIFDIPELEGFRVDEHRRVWRIDDQYVPVLYHMCLDDMPVYQASLANRQRQPQTQQEFLERANFDYQVNQQSVELSQFFPSEQQKVEQYQDYLERANDRTSGLEFVDYEEWQRRMGYSARPSPSTQKPAITLPPNVDFSVGAVYRSRMGREFRREYTARVQREMQEANTPSYQWLSIPQIEQLWEYFLTQPETWYR